MRLRNPFKRPPEPPAVPSPEERITRTVAALLDQQYTGTPDLRTLRGFQVMVDLDGPPAVEVTLRFNR